MQSWREIKTCARKKRYPTYNQAKEALHEMADKARDIRYLKVYKCPQSKDTPHFHLGNASGYKKKIIDRRIEKQRRKQLVKEALS